MSTDSRLGATVKVQLATLTRSKHTACQNQADQPVRRSLGGAGWGNVTAQGRGILMDSTSLTEVKIGSESDAISEAGLGGAGIKPGAKN